VEHVEPLAETAESLGAVDAVAVELVSTSSAAMSSATRMALCRGSSSRLKPMRTRSVRAAMAAASGMIDGE
jgi:hypothetical protein